MNHVHNVRAAQEGAANAQQASKQSSSKDQNGHSMNAQQEAMQKMQAIEQSLHTQMAQRTAYQSQLLELENAHSELGSAKESYRIIGNIMVKTEPAALAKELEDKKASLQTRITSIERQEKRVREEMQKLQEQILHE